MNRRILHLCPALCLALGGCYEKVSENGNLEFGFQPWVPLLVALAGVATVPVGIVLFIRKQRFWGVCVAVGGPLIAAVVAPGMYLDRVVVNEKGFYSRHGFWWNPTIHQIHYQELDNVQVAWEVKNSRRGKTYSYYFDCYFKTRVKERVPLGDIMREALPEIVDQFRKHGVIINVPKDLPG